MVIPNRQSEHRKSEICSRYPYQLHSANNKYFTQATRIPHQNPSQPRIEGLDWQSSVNRNWTLRMTVTVPLTAWTKNVRNMVAGRATIITDIPFWQLCSGARPKWKSRRRGKKTKTIQKCSYRLSPSRLLLQWPDSLHGSVDRTGTRHAHNWLSSKRTRNRVW